MPRQWVDRGVSSTLAGCECGWRCMESDPPGAWRAALTHAKRVHPEEVSTTSRAYQRAVKRHG